MRRYKLSRRADRDLLDILIFGIETFGLAQAERYRASLVACFERLADAPGMGRLSPASGVAVRRHEHGSHVIFYETQSDGVLVLSVIHARSVPARLDRD